MKQMKKKIPFDYCMLIPYSNRNLVRHFLNQLPNMSLLVTSISKQKKWNPAFFLQLRPSHPPPLLLKS